MTSLTDRARVFVESGDEDQESLLRECLQAGNLDALRAVQIMFEDMYGGHTYNYEIKAPAAVCLIRWGEQGLEALIEATGRTETSKNISLTLQILASLASRADLPDVGRFIRDKGILPHIRDSVTNWELLSKIARSKLQRFILSFENDDDVCLAVGLELLSAPFRGGSSVALELFQALASRWLAVSQPVLDLYENMLTKNPTDESAFHTFFERHPQLLDPLAAEVWSQPDLHGAMEPDFVVRRNDNTYVVVEIETPAKLLMTKSGQISAHATHAVRQAIEYAKFLINRWLEANATFPGFQNPDSLVVIGMEGKLTTLQSRALSMENGSRNRLTIVGFDWLLSRAKAVAMNTIAQEIPVHRERLV